MMVKGISKQVIVVQSPEPKLFEQAIFILNENAMNEEGITDDALMKEAKRLIQNPLMQHPQSSFHRGALWACGGAGITALIWLISSFL